jgi:PBP1b-binding outer membrane lipoprotein LpoB
MNKTAIAILCIAIIFLFLAGCVKLPEGKAPESDSTPTTEMPEPPDSPENQGDGYNVDDIFSDEEEVQPPIIPA